MRVVYVLVAACAVPCGTHASACCGPPGRVRRSASGEVGRVADERVGVLYHELSLSIVSGFEF
jgi:hypothetical protein